MDRWGVVVVGCREDLMALGNGVYYLEFEDTWALVYDVGFFRS